MGDDARWLASADDVVARAGVVVVGKATSAEEGLVLVERLLPALLIIDLLPRQGRMDGLSLIRRARARGGSPKTILFSCSEAAGDVEAAFAAGAVAYVLKTAEPDDFVSAIRQAFARSVFLSAPRAASPKAEDGAGRRLTRREREILELVAEGQSNAQVARLLWVTEQTVKFHLSNIYRKLEVSNRTEAARWAQAHGVLAVPRAYDAEVA